MIHIAKIIVSYHHYESKTTKDEQIHIVDGIDEKDVKEKITHFYDLKDVEYYCTHSVEFVCVNCLIS